MKLIDKIGNIKQIIIDMTLIWKKKKLNKNINRVGYNTERRQQRPTAD